jgi:MraZ protein
MYQSGTKWNMIFLGTYEHTIDDKNRINLPAKFFSKLSKTIYVSKGFDKCLEIRCEDDFEDYAKKLLSYSNNSSDVRKVQRVFLGLSSRIEIDSSKRILLPANLLANANITKQVVVLGVGKKIEL